MSNKYTLLTSKGICMNFLLELKFFILSHPVTSKQPHKIVQIHMGHPVGEIYARIAKSATSYCSLIVLPLTNFILHPLTSKQPHKIVQIHMGHPVDVG